MGPGSTSRGPTFGPRHLWVSPSSNSAGDREVSGTVGRSGGSGSQTSIPRQRNTISVLQANKCPVRNGILFRGEYVKRFSHGLIQLDRKAL